MVFDGQMVPTHVGYSSSVCGVTNWPIRLVNFRKMEILSRWGKTRYIPSVLCPFEFLSRSCSHSRSFASLMVRPWYGLINNFLFSFDFTWDGWILDKRMTSAPRTDQRHKSTVTTEASIKPIFVTLQISSAQSLVRCSWCICPAFPAVGGVATFGRFVWEREREKSWRTQYPIVSYHNNGDMGAGASAASMSMEERRSIYKVAIKRN